MVTAVSGWSADWNSAYFDLARDLDARVPLTVSPAELSTVLDDCTQALGFQYFALIDPIDSGPCAAASASN